MLMLCLDASFLPAWLIPQRSRSSPLTRAATAPVLPGPRQRSFSNQPRPEQEDQNIQQPPSSSPLSALPLFSLPNLPRILDSSPPSSPLQSGTSVFDFGGGSVGSSTAHATGSGEGSTVPSDSLALRAPPLRRQGSSSSSIGARQLVRTASAHPSALSRSGTPARIPLQRSVSCNGIGPSRANGSAARQGEAAQGRAFPYERILPATPIAPTPVFARIPVVMTETHAEFELDEEAEDGGTDSHSSTPEKRVRQD